MLPPSMGVVLRLCLSRTLIAGEVLRTGPTVVHVRLRWFVAEQEHARVLRA
jgi:hypothetical protein